jgi:hypothetical protein
VSHQQRIADSLVSGRSERAGDRGVTGVALGAAVLFLIGFRDDATTARREVAPGPSAISTS